VSSNTSTHSSRFSRHWNKLRRFIPIFTLFNDGFVVVWPAHRRLETFSISSATDVPCTTTSNAALLWLRIISRSLRVLTLMIIVWNRWYLLLPLWFRRSIAEDHWMRSKTYRDWLISPLCLSLWHLSRIYSVCMRVLRQENIVSESIFRWQFHSAQ